MAKSIFDGLPDIFVDSFGEPVSYTPIATGVPIGTGDPPVIQAIWTESSLDSGLGTDAPTDAGRTTLSVRAADVTPVENDTAVRVADGKTMKVATPILPDGNGMIRCDLVAVS